MSGSGEERLIKIPNTFGLNVHAAAWLEYASIEELEQWIACGHITAPYLHIGSGSNLLFLDDYRGMVLHSGITGITVTGEDTDRIELRVGAGVLWDDFVAYTVEHRLYGAENLSHIPGETGAAAVQNIGAYGVEVKDLITAVETVSLSGEKHTHSERRTYAVGECAYAYRDSLFKRPEMKHCFVTHVRFCLRKQEHYTLNYGILKQELAAQPAVTLVAVRQAIIRIRNSKLPDPRVWGNAGSFFKNPVVPYALFERLHGQYPQMPFYAQDDGLVKIPAAWLIEQCGWKGRSLGAAAVYDKQPLVLVNRGGATGQEIKALSDAVQQSVHHRFGIEIQPEVNFIG
ncbi:MAG: UDP-N-acetylmuramate dehydrogenase [Prevotellaceae bacterium]|jgi:UDP-N-acetylmuramate dehydrogenase|nr:UDP-N-acetylmuramate dehydrogenase [Prevotellaceae bacterium]